MKTQPLLRSLSKTIDGLDRLSVSLAEIEDGIELALCDIQTRNLAARRGFDSGSILESLSALNWSRDDSLDQIGHLLEELKPLLEPARNAQTTRYGRRHGVYVRTPLDENRCGTRANYQAHLRRGQDACDKCRAAMWAYGVRQRWQRRLRKQEEVISFPLPAAS